jgi:hypothetical protein
MKMGLLKRRTQKNPWGNVQFFHEQSKFRCLDRKKFTVAIAMPTVKQLLKLQQRLVKSIDYESPPLTIRIGRTTVNPKDQYTRSIGRKLSFERIQPVQFFLNRVEIIHGRSNFEFSGLSDGKITYVTLVVTPHSDRAQLRHVAYKKIPFGMQERINAKSKEMSSGAEDQSSSTSVRPALRDERGGDCESDTECDSLGTSLTV